MLFRRYCSSFYDAVSTNNIKYQLSTIKPLWFSFAVLLAVPVHLHDRQMDNEQQYTKHSQYKQQAIYSVVFDSDCNISFPNPGQSPSHRPLSATRTSPATGHTRGKKSRVACELTFTPLTVHNYHISYGAAQLVTPLLLLQLRGLLGSDTCRWVYSDFRHTRWTAWPRSRRHDDHSKRRNCKPNNRASLEVTSTSLSIHDWRARPHSLHILRSCESLTDPAATISFVMSVRLSACNNSAPTGQISIKLQIWRSFKSLQKKNTLSLQMWEE